MDEFKPYLFNHRDELDVEAAPGAHVWQKIREDGRSIRVRRFPLLVKWVAAAAVVGAVITLGLVYLPGDHGSADPSSGKQASAGKENTSPTPAIKDTMNAKASAPSLVRSSTPDENPVATKPVLIKQGQKKRENKQGSILTPAPLVALEDNYGEIIRYQVKRLERTPIYTEDPQYFDVFKKQWQKLEEDEKKVKQEVRTYGLSDEVVDQLIVLYQQKLSLLKSLQSEINQMNIRARQYPDMKKNQASYLKL